jgi:hypothetical protein
MAAQAGISVLCLQHSILLSTDDFHAICCAASDQQQMTLH